MTVLDGTQTANYGELADADLSLLWREAGRNFTCQRIVALNGGAVPEGYAEEAYVRLREAMVERKLPLI